ncbi:hypothetical protein INT80_11165 [Gallibacterium anatis]|uniref:Uncharacterized protein n=1 Tax=Gallibacterium anatis TaxID=750 RepID=A0A930Y5B9_9PAST|nr:hypothetical protein [Gallibacterium anatis]
MPEGESAYQGLKDVDALPEVSVPTSDDANVLPALQIQKTLRMLKKH